VIRRRREGLADRARGVLLGLAAGDALGAPLEWLHPEQIAARFGGPLRDLVEAPPWRRGEWTDDTAMALCLAESVIDKGGYDAEDAFARYALWVRSRPRDLGPDVAWSLSRSRSAEEARADAARRAPGEGGDGSGCLVRTPPLALRYLNDPGALERCSRLDAGLTDADPAAGDACVWLNMTIAALVRGRRRPRSRSAVAAEAEAAVGMDADALAEQVQNRPGSVRTVLRVAFAAAFGHDDAERALVFATNLGGDADAAGAVTGALAGARFGASGLPERWLDPLAERARISGLATRLLRR
jgi:ADP-ribosyl-[dinitrogen reductase] hydrolase